MPPGCVILSPLTRCSPPLQGVGLVSWGFMLLCQVSELVPGLFANQRLIFLFLFFLQKDQKAPPWCFTLLSHLALQAAGVGSGVPAAGGRSPQVHRQHLRSARGRTVKLLGQNGASLRPHRDRGPGPAPGPAPAPRPPPPPAAGGR